MPQHHTPQVPALRLVEAEPEALVHPTADRRLAVEQWLLEAAKDPQHTRQWWREHGVALLPLGTLFSAVRIPGRLIVALTASTEPDGIDAFLGQVLDGPVICDPRGPRYYALVPTSMPTSWRKAVDDWRAVTVDTLGRGTHLGVPRVDATRAVWRPLGGGRRTVDSYWSVPMSSAGVLCAPLNVARLIAASCHQLVAELNA